MNARAYYNENDPFACAFLRELMADGLICPGEVDERSIEDVKPSDLAGYSQHHFFAGIGVWSLALRQSVWRDDRPIWTGSCPCQPFSAAGKAGGFTDERHLWPAFFHLIGECRPSVVVGEQVASKDGLAWLDLVSADMEGAGYAFGAVDTCAAGFGAPHIRQRLYFGAKRMADTTLELGDWRGDAGPRRWAKHSDGGATCWMADADEGQCRRLADGEGCERDGEATGRIKGNGIAQSSSNIFGLADAAGSGQSRSSGSSGPQDQRITECGLLADERGRPDPVNGLWRNADWLFCRDGKWRPVEPGTFPLADGGTFRNRVAELRGAGNAINLAQAVGFLEAFRESIDANQSTEALDHV